MTPTSRPATTLPADTLPTTPRRTPGSAAATGDQRWHGCHHTATCTGCARHRPRPGPLAQCDHRRGSPPTGASRVLTASGGARALPAGRAAGRIRARIADARGTPHRADASDHLSVAAFHTRACRKGNPRD